MRSPGCSTTTATLALGPEAPLRRAALVDLVTDLAWSDQRVAVHGAVVWALLGDLSRDPDLPGDLRVEDAAPGGSANLVVVTGPDRVRRRLAGMAHAAGTQFLVANGPDDEHDLAGHRPRGDAHRRRCRRRGRRRPARPRPTLDRPGRAPGRG